MNETAKHNCVQFDGETLMSYMYGELDGSFAVRVEDHLVECANCRAEFTDLSEGHLSIFEWNKLEFAPLSTPAINIEYAKKRGAFAAFTEAFAAAGTWRLAVPAFAALVIALTGFAMYSGVFSGGSEMAMEQPGEIAAPAAEQSVIKEPLVRPKSPVAEPVSEAAESAPDTYPITVSSHPEPSGPRPTRPVSPKYVNAQRPSAITVADGPMRLNDLEEFEDDSPRLSDLFDETEAS